MESARATVEEACAKLLANPVMEDVHIDIAEKAAGASA
jgi:phosphoribosylformylglycinamidine (FGAM) synthase PurS component